LTACRPFPLCAVVLVSSIILGGGTRAGFLSDAALQLLAVPLLVISLWHLIDAGVAQPLRVPLLLLCAFVVLVLAQTAPLPPYVWTRLPERQELALTFQLLGRDPPWLPLSVTPQATWLSAVSLIVPSSVFLATAQLGLTHRRRLSLCVLVASMVGAVVGLMQMAEGPASMLRLFRITNPDDAVGFFANRNHFSALLYSTILFATAWAMYGASSLSPRYRRASAAMLFPVAGLSAIVLLSATQLLTGSRAGLVLSAAALAGTLVVAARSPGGPVRPMTAGLLLGATALAGLLAADFALPRIADRLTRDPLMDARIDILRTSVEAARLYMPFGTGLGTFVPAYARLERPENALPEYINRAHNDYVELAIETGLPGLAILAAALCWLAARAVKVWRTPSPPVRAIDAALARAASIVLVLLAAHSLVDYPLRTAALSALFAFACGLIVDPPRTDAASGMPRTSMLR
jgi:O-antigen ligase